MHEEDDLLPACEPRDLTWPQSRPVRDQWDVTLDAFRRSSAEMEAILDRQRSAVREVQRRADLEALVRSGAVRADVQPTKLEQDEPIDLATDLQRRVRDWRPCHPLAVALIEAAELFGLGLVESARARLEYAATLESLPRTAAEEAEVRTASEVCHALIGLRGGL